MSGFTDDEDKIPILYPVYCKQSQTLDDREAEVSVLPLSVGRLLPLSMVALACTGAATAQDPSFAEWCADADAPDEDRYTVQVILAALELDDCAAADASLRARDTLDLQKTDDFGLD